MTNSTPRTAVVAVLGLMLAGCGGDSEPSAAPTSETASGSPSASPSPSPSPSPSASSSAAPAPEGGFTKQGTELKFGEKALVPFKSMGMLGTIGVTATEIKKGDPAELAPLKLGDQAAGLTPFYVNFVVTNESASDFKFTSLGLASGQLADGSRAQRVSVIGDFPPCDNSSAAKDFTTKGASYTTCVLTLAGGSSMVTAATYTGLTDSGFPDTDYGRDPIVWK